MKLLLATILVLALPAPSSFADGDCPGFEEFVRNTGRCPEKAADPETFGDAFYRRTGQIKDVELVDSTDCPGLEEYVRTHGHCPQKAAEPPSFGDEFYRRTGQTDR